MCSSDLGKNGWGYKVARLKRGRGYLLRLKAWGPGMFLMEIGRYRKRAYRGFGGAFPILRSFVAGVESGLNAKLRKAFIQLEKRAGATP